MRNDLLCISALLLLAASLAAQPTGARFPFTHSLYQYADPGDYTVLLEMDFDMYAEADPPSNAAVEAGFPYGGYEDADTLSTGIWADNIAFEDLGGGDIALRNDYPAGAYSVEAYYWLTGMQGGTGTIWRMYVDAGHNDYQRFRVFCNCWFQSTWQHVKGMKLVSADSRAAGGHTSRNSLLTIADLGLQEGYDAVADSAHIQYYNFGYSSANGTPPPSFIHGYPYKFGDDGYGARPDTLWTGQWINVCFEVDAGSQDNQDAYTCVYLNGVLKGCSPYFYQQTVQEDEYFFDMADIQTFLGGDDDSYSSPQTQYMWMNDFIVTTGWTDMNGTRPTNGKILKLPIESRYLILKTSPE